MPEILENLLNPFGTKYFSDYNKKVLGPLNGPTVKTEPGSSSWLLRDATTCTRFAGRSPRRSPAPARWRWSSGSPRSCPCTRPTEIQTLGSNLTIKVNEYLYMRRHKGSCLPRFDDTGFHSSNLIQYIYQFKNFFDVKPGLFHFYTFFPI